MVEIPNITLNTEEIQHSKTYYSSKHPFILQDNGSAPFGQNSAHGKWKSCATQSTCKAPQDRGTDSPKLYFVPAHIIRKNKLYFDKFSHQIGNLWRKKNTSFVYLIIYPTSKNSLHTLSLNWFLGVREEELKFRNKFYLQDLKKYRRPPVTPIARLSQI